MGEWATVAHVVNYLMRVPIEETLNDFFSLAQQLRDLGRFSLGLPSVFQGALRLLETHAAPWALVAPEVVPFRPNRGVYGGEDARHARPLRGERGRGRPPNYPNQRFAPRQWRDPRSSRLTGSRSGGSCHRAAVVVGEQIRERRCSA